MFKMRALMAVALCATTCSVHASQLLKDSYWEDVARERGLDPAILYSVALKEARLPNHEGDARPYPWTLRSSNGGKRFNTYEEAKHALIQALLTDPPKNIDIGIMQINWHYHNHRVNSALDLLDPKTAIQVGADILIEAIQSRPGDLAIGIGRYYSSNDERARQYGEEVLRIANEINNL